MLREDRALRSEDEFTELLDQKCVTPAAVKKAVEWSKWVTELQQSEPSPMQPQFANSPSPAQMAAAVRHAQVVPSFVLPSLSRTLECWAGTVSPGELVRWKRQAELTE